MQRNKFQRSTLDLKAEDSHGYAMQAVTIRGGSVFPSAASSTRHNNLNGTSLLPLVPPRRASQNSWFGESMADATPEMGYR
jgi:hypothetical protein